ncbi:hypothetical protein CERSUDRAFT_74615 [Gelatoporia subvermispora B]|uniref:Uncharacterized protein n=1 Tax=Ceriporiopsis subvermispora (strain B) TaxID=914234 RepID=M2RBJ1_CERS8|nr:hypothetical protein CERSUDRAFT_74615 [Gelatoporia subvermispora B]
MNTFPVPRPQRGRPADNRDSGLRASILESALELGVGSSRTVAHWIFNAVPEEGEEADAEEESTISPSLTYGSTATSDASSLSSLPSSNLHPGVAALNPPQRSIQFAVSAPPEPLTMTPSPAPAPATGFFRPNKLRKARSNGYESDGGYLSDGGKGKKEKEKKSKKKVKESGNATEHESDGGHLSESSKKKGKKGKKGKDADVMSPATDYDTDGGGISRLPGMGRTRKTSVMSPTIGDESDGGNLSEASTKKKRFFRLNSRSPRKRKDSASGGSPQQEEIPPVPALPPVPLPIHEMFSRTGTPSLDSTPDESRTVTPIPSVSVTVDRPSHDVPAPPMDMSDAASIRTHDGLTKAFRDAESVRSPSIDVLSTFRALARPKAGSFDSVHPYARMYQGPPSPQPPSSPMVVSPPNATSSRPKISAPNTSTLVPKHVPMPLVLTPASPAHAQRLVPSPDPDYIFITPPVTPTGTSRPPSSPRSAGVTSEFLVPALTTQPSQAAPPSPTGRSHLLGYYDLPPPTPPPQGPLPAVPPETPAAQSPASSTASPVTEARRPVLRNVSSLSRINLPAGPPGPPPSRELPTPPDSTGRAPISRAPSAFRASPVPPEVPSVAQPIPPSQRGRQSPFPVQPVLPRTESSDLVRRTSTRALRVVASSNALQARGASPASADGRGESWFERSPASKEQLRVHWQPRSASALEKRTEDFFEDDASNTAPAPAPTLRERGSWVQEFVPRSPRSSFEDDLDLDDDRSLYTSEEHASPGGHDMLTPGEDGDDMRSSVWSDANSRTSFMDGERSAKVHERLLKQVEQMYGKAEPIPPVPHLNYPMRNGSF